MTSVAPAYLNAYIDRLKAHDWHYEQSDDPRVFKAGLAAEQKLRREAESEPFLRPLFDAACFVHSARCTDGLTTRALTFDEFAEVCRRRLVANATARPDPTHRLAACVRSLAHALARADPDNGAPQRAMKLLQDLQLLESTLLPAKPHVDP